MSVSAIESDLYNTLGIGAGQATADKPRDQLLQDDFLELMVAQLKNQDPFKPMESGEFLGDIAQFGTVSGIQDLQKAFDTLSSSIQSSQALQAAGLVDRQVLVPADRGELTAGDGLAGALELPSSASQVAVNIYGPAGDLVRRLDLGSQAGGLVQFKWDGTADDGSMAAPGTYRISAEASIAGETTAVTPLVIADVRSVTLGGSGGGLLIDLGALGTIDFSQVRQIL